MSIYKDAHPALQLAHAFSSEFNNAIIAGGVARDLFNQRPFNDIDVFIPCISEMEQYEKIISVTKFCCENKLDVELSNDYNALVNLFRIKATDPENDEVKLDFCFTKNTLNT